MMSNGGAEGSTRGRLLNTRRTSLTSPPLASQAEPTTPAISTTRSIQSQGASSRSLPASSCTCCATTASRA